MILSDRELLRVWPDSVPGPASIDLRIGDTLLRWPRYDRRDPRIDQSHVWKPEPLDSDESDQFWTLVPGIRYLATTQERIKIPDDLAGFISARSSWGRDGLSVIQGPAGYLDPGFEGYVVLELSVLGSELVVRPGDAVCQLVVHRLESPALRPYGHPSRNSKYQGQSGVTPSRTHLDFAGVQP
jgi:dCTP deaminase